MLWPLPQERAIHERGTEFNSEAEAEQDSTNLSRMSFVSEFSQRVLFVLPVQGPLFAASRVRDA
jgi:hypothetical protein